MGSDVLIRYTRAGDADLDGKCGDEDATLVGLYYDNGATTGHLWMEADFNYDGLIDDSDATALGLFYHPNAPPLMMAQQSGEQELESNASLAWQDILVAMIRNMNSDAAADAVEAGLIMRWGSW
jgi:hypothetical protein